MNVQSNALRSDFMRDVVDLAIHEIHDDISTVFGPCATDAFITKDGQPYYTRDGKEVLESIIFDNELCNYILKIIYQSVAHQGNVIGDGTTTLAVFYTNLYKAIRYNQSLCRRSISQVRPVWTKIIQQINNEILGKAHPMTDDEFKSAIFTCTQDAELSSKIYQKLSDKIMDGAYIIVNKSNIATDFNVTVHEDPIFKVTKQFTLRPFDGKMSNCAMYHCNGMMDIAHPNVLLRLMQRVMSYGGGARADINIVFICNGLTEATRNTLKKVVSTINANGIDPKELNNITIFTLDEYRGFTNDQIEDLSTIITDEYGIGGLVNSLVFEANLYQAMCAVEGDEQYAEFESLRTFATDSHILTKLMEMFTNVCNVEFDESEGLRIHKTLGPVAQDRYNKLHDEIENEKSPARKVSLHKRLRSIYGQFVEVEVGSKLIKDSQRKYELILDAVRSSLEAVKNGVLPANSILIAMDTAAELCIEGHNDGSIKKDSIENEVYSVILKALFDTFCDMMDNAGFNVKDIYPSYVEFCNDIICDADLTKFDINRGDKLDDIIPPLTVSNEARFDDQEITIPATDDYDEFTVVKTIVEPVGIITNILENSTTPLELALARTFHMNSFMQNYLSMDLEAK